MSENAVGIIGGSGLYEIEGFELSEELTIETPFGAPSDKLISGKIAGRQVYFLPRHGRTHSILPSEINHRANIWALRSLGVRWIIGVGAVGSLKEEYAPTHMVIPDQYYDRTSRRENHTFFGNGIVAHVAFGYPTASGLREILNACSKEQGCITHHGGTYVNMDGPAFSTKAESLANRQLGFDLIGMTNLPEAKLSREAEIAYASLCMVTDYDCWKDHDVNIQELIGYLHQNTSNAKEIVKKAIADIPTEANWPEHTSLEFSIMTNKEHWPKETKEMLKPLINRFL